MKILLIAGVILFSALEAQAQFYVGASVVSKNDTFKVDAFTHYKGEGVGWKIYGGWEFLPFLAVEGGYRDLGHYAYASASASGDLEAKAIDGAVRAHVTVSRFDLFAKAGYARLDWVGDLRLSPIGHPTFDEKQWDVLYGAGVELKVVLGLFARLEWEHFQAADGLSSFSLGMNYRF